MTFEKYSHIVDNLLDRHWGIVDVHIDVKKFTSNFGRIDGKIILLDGS